MIRFDTLGMNLYQAFDKLSISTTCIRLIIRKIMNQTKIVKQSGFESSAQEIWPGERHLHLQNSKISFAVVAKFG
jgi:hypothetical protein